MNRPFVSTEDYNVERSEHSQPVFQFSPEFHRVPSPIFNTPHVTFIAPEDRRNNESHHTSQVTSEVEQSNISEQLNEGIVSDDTETANAASVRSNMVTARAKFFEQEIQHQQQPSPKARMLTNILYSKLDYKVQELII